MSDSDLFFASLHPHIFRIDLHGISDIVSALEQLEKELFFAFQKGELYCQVIHGIGSGKLAAAVHESLQKHPMVQNFHEAESGGSCSASF